MTVLPQLHCCGELSLRQRHSCRICCVATTAYRKWLRSLQVELLRGERLLRFRASKTTAAPWCNACNRQSSAKPAPASCFPPSLMGRLVHGGPDGRGRKCCLSVWRCRNALSVLTGSHVSFMAKTAILFQVLRLKRRLQDASAEATSAGRCFRAHTCHADGRGRRAAFLIISSSTCIDCEVDS